MDKFKTTDNGGLPVVLDDIRWFLGQSSNQAIYQAINDLLRNFGDNFIVEGCTLTGMPSVRFISDGWIMLGGELLKVDAQGPFNEATDNTYVKQTTYVATAPSRKTFQDGSVNDTYEKNRGVVSGSGGTLGIAGDRYQTAIRQAAGLLRQKVIDIGDWNMNVSVAGSAFVDVAHGIADWTKIRSISVLIRADTGFNQNTDLISGNVGSGSHTGDVCGSAETAGANIRLRVKSGNFYDTTNYDATSYNRGWITIWYAD